MKVLSEFKNNINIFLYKLSYNLIFFFLSINAFFFCSLILRFNLRKIKKIFCKSKEKRIIVLSKSGGIDDLLASYKKNGTTNKIEFFTLPRNLIKAIYFKYLNDSAYGDYQTLQEDPKTLVKRNNYKNSLKKIFMHLDKYWKFDGIIGFNLFYFAEHDLHQAIHDIKKRSIVLQKESAYPKIEEIYNRTLYKNNSPFGGDKISVYSENEKKMLIESGLASAQQVIVTGCARLDLAFGYKNTEIGNSTILYYMIEKERSIPGRKHFVSWSNLKLETEKYLIDYAKKNPQKKIIFKGKVGVHTRSELPKKLPKNCLYIGNSPGHELLKLSNVVVCFNSTVLYEAIAAKKNLIIPFFNLNFSEVEEHLLVIPNSIDLIKNHQEFYEKLDLYTSKNILKKILDNSEKEVLGFYFGNNDGKSGSRTKLFLENAMFN
tara:strand:+ start:4080 stop:5372 length:1293 start_codon:yes stop_codon:yes gene_type:complete